MGTSPFQVNFFLSAPLFHLFEYRRFVKVGGYAYAVWVLGLMLDFLPGGFIHLAEFQAQPVFAGVFAIRHLSFYKAVIPAAVIIVSFRIGTVVGFAFRSGRFGSGGHMFSFCVGYGYFHLSLEFGRIEFIGQRDSFQIFLYRAAQFYQLRIGLYSVLHRVSSVALRVYCILPGGQFVVLEVGYYLVPCLAGLFLYNGPLVRCV